MITPLRECEIPMGKLLEKGLHDFERRALLGDFMIHTAYIIINKADILYIGGTSLNPRERIGLHINQKSDIGLYIVANRPQSDNWIVKILKYKNRKEVFQAEKQLISQYNPLFNKAGKTK